MEQKLVRNRAVIDRNRSETGLLLTESEESDRTAIIDRK